MTHKRKTAIVIGATGLTGFQLTKQLIENDKFEKIIVLGRSKTGLQSDKLQEHIVDFDKPESFAEFVKGDVLFSCLGTTIKKARTKENQYKVDVTYQYEVAKAAKLNNVATLILISAPGANPKSLIFYSKIKGELENKIKELSFERYLIFQPSVLMGQRTEKRTGEEFAAKFVNFFSKILPFLKKYRGIDTTILAQAMIKAYISDEKNKTYKLGEIFNNLSST
ncbi:MAG: NAD(P)H-binding protein [Bacteroidales bacterium]|nr:NAD(P)H-binding protein [Bacteroidales bacterium]MDD4218102.1 NAD(P)H-binding protein [Bacteroidales bacterium]MDY0140393.1 NAD(P)H-binding protein [Bacteroidales bacterium]